jgi:lethal(2) giant larvae protein
MFGGSLFNIMVLRAEFDEPHTLLVLAEEELVAVDLLTEGWPVLRQPYWCSLHSSAVTSSLHVANVPDDFWNKIVDVGQHQFANYSTRVSSITTAVCRHC